MPPERPVQGPTFPVSRAYVIRFRPGRVDDAFEGRVEHVLTGRRGDFDSPDALLRLLRTGLEDPRRLAERSTEPPPPSRKEP